MRTLVPISLALSFALMGCGDKDVGSDTGTTDDGITDDGTSDDGGTGSYADADEDTILDIHEGVDEERDSDGDGTPDYLDTDSDDDTITDKREAGDSDPLTLPVDTDGDGTEDFLDLDSDNNCISDKSEKGSGPADSDSDGIYDFQDFDNDGDGILDVYEIGEDCANPDTDGDGTPNYQDLDSDGDGIGDAWEAGTSAWQEEPVDTDGDGVYDYLDDDSDDDGFSDTLESGVDDIYDEPRDTDGDGRPDFQDTDSDGDSLSDSEERDTYGTDPYDADTDGDGFSDGGEIAAETDPLDGDSVIDGIYVVVPERTETEEDFEFELRIQMGDIALLVDTTCSMSSTANAIASEYSTIVDVLTETIPDAEYGVATYDDYAYASYGSAGTDKPFELRQQVTDDIDEVQSALSDEVQIHSGADGPESSMEALYQGATGAGYDQSCDGSYDSQYDVYPYIANASDPFAGGGGEFYDSSYTGGGVLGGFGFRDYALPVFVYATDNYLRDPENGYGTPGGCWLDAGKSDVVTAFSDLGAYMIGICTGSVCVTQMEDLADATGSFADTDGDGSADDRLVFQWTGSSTEFQETITDAIEDLVNSISFDKVELEIEGDEWGFVTAIDPEYYEDVTELGVDTLDFTLEFRGTVAATTEDQLYKLTLNIVGDETILLDTLDIIILVPGTID